MKTDVRLTWMKIRTYKIIEINPSGGAKMARKLLELVN